MNVEYTLELIEALKEIRKSIELCADRSGPLHDEMRRMTDEHDKSRTEQEAIWTAIGGGVLRQARLAVAQDDFECLQAEWRREHKLIMDTRPVE